MNHFPAGGLIGKTVRLIRSLSALHIPLHASSACYFLALSLFPALVLLLGLLRYTPLQIADLIHALEGLLPEALLPYAEELILSTYENTTGTVLSLSAFTALWSASRGIHGLLDGLNAVYRTSEDRGYFRTRIISVGYTFVFLLVLILTLVLQVFGTAIVDMLSDDAHPLIRLLAGIVNLRFILLLFLQSAVFTAMFMVFPNRRNSLTDSLPGALFASLGWLVFSNLFSLYVENFGSYANIYGSVYTVALSLLWLYCCICILFYGGVLNRLLMPGPEEG